MTHYELRTIASHHRSWLKAQREGILRGANLRRDFSETMRDLEGPPQFAVRGLSIRYRVVDKILGGAFSARNDARRQGLQLQVCVPLF